MVVSLTSKRGYGAFLLPVPRPQRFDGAGAGAVAAADGFSSKWNRGASSEGMIGKNVDMVRDGGVGPQAERRAQGETR